MIESKSAILANNGKVEKKYIIPLNIYALEADFLCSGSSFLVGSDVLPKEAPLILQSHRQGY